jgi:hypothetical protein
LTPDLVFKKYFTLITAKILEIFTQNTAIWGKTIKTLGSFLEKCP